MIDDLTKRHVGEYALRRHALALRRRGDSRELVTRLLLVGFREHLAQIGEVEVFVAYRRLKRHAARPPSVRALRRAARRNAIVSEEGSGFTPPDAHAVSTQLANAVASVRPPAPACATPTR